MALSLSEKEGNPSSSAKGSQLHLDRLSRSQWPLIAFHCPTAPLLALEAPSPASIVLWFTHIPLVAAGFVMSVGHGTSITLTYLFSLLSSCLSFFESQSLKVMKSTN